MPSLRATPIYGTQLQGKSLGGLVSERLSIEERFQSKLVRRGDCLLFQGWANKSGHTKFAITRRNFIGAHRFAWMMSGRALAKHKQLHHLCHNPACCNPAHLKLITRELH